MFAYEYPVIGGSYPQDSGYAVYAAITSLIPELHGRKGLQIAPLGGTRLQQGGRLKASPKTHLHIRGITPSEALLLQNQHLLIRDSFIALGTCQIRPLAENLHYPNLCSRLVVYKDLEQVRDAGVFLARLRQQLETLGEDSAKVRVEINRGRALKFHTGHFLGYSVTLSNCSSDLALKILTQGLGHFRAMGCGVFRGYK